MSRTDLICNLLKHAKTVSKKGPGFERVFGLILEKLDNMPVDQGVIQRNEFDTKEQWVTFWLLNGLALKLEKLVDAYLEPAVVECVDVIHDVKETLFPNHETVLFYGMTDGSELQIGLSKAIETTLYDPTYKDLPIPSMITCFLTRPSPQLELPLTVSLT